MPQRHKTRIDPDNLLRKSLERIVYGRPGHETTGARPRGQSLKQKRPEVSDPGHSPGPDIGVTGSWTSESWDSDPAGLDLGEGGQRDLEAGEEELVIESIDEHLNELNSKPVTEPPDNLEHTMRGKEGEIDITDVTLASEDGTRIKAHRLSSAAEGGNPPEGESLENGCPEKSISGPLPASSAPGEDSSERYGPELSLIHISEPTRPY